MSKIAASTGVQGLVQGAMGGSFKDGALAGFAGALGQQVAGQMLQGIDAAVDAGTMTPIEAAAARTFARMLGSAIRASATPGDPNQAFASAFLGDVMGTIEVRPPLTQTAFDDNGYLNPGIVAVKASPAQQAAQLAAYLQRQGMPAAQAASTAQLALNNVVDGVAQLPQSPQPEAIWLPPVFVTGKLDPVRAAFNEALYLAGAAGEVFTGSSLLELASKVWGRTLSGLTELVALAPELSLKALGAGLTLLTMPSNVGASTQRVQISDSLRFEQAPGEVGRLLEQKADGNWQVIKTGVQLGMLGHQRVALTGDEIRALTAPMANPSDPRPTPPLFTPMPSSDERLNELPGLEQAAPAGPTTSTTPIETQTWQDLLIRSHSKDLAENMRLDGVSRPPNSASHHIASWDHPDAGRARAILDKFDVGIDDAANGVYLLNTRDSIAPGAYHPRLHNSDYYSAVEALLERATSTQSVIDTLGDIREQLLAGTFPGSRPRPITTPRPGVQP